MRRPPLRAAAAALTAATVVALLGVAVGDAPDGPAAPVITVSERDCGAGWGAGSATSPAGHLLLRLSDTARDPAEVYLIAPGNGEVYAEVLSLLPGVDRTLTTTLDGGSYALRCVFTDGTVLTSSIRTLTGTLNGAGAVAGVRPLPDLDLGAPVAAYRGYVTAALPGLLTDSRRLAGDLAAGDLARARADWLPAHLDYERLGAAYNSFGDFDRAIDGTADGLSGGTADPSWTGFHRIEYGLWHGQGAAVLKPLGSGLVKDVQDMVADFPSADTDPGDLPLRSHEILENALQFQLSGAADYGSGTALATLQANIQGTRAVLGTLTALITPRAPALLPAVDAELSVLDAGLSACRTPDGGWTAPTALPLTRRQQLDSALGGVLEQLSTVPDLLQGRPSA
ncbi:EfeM/EfeO family lipoprotein [Streptacidiphilus carbonis]|uniref:EfeM/EfeO family lipoprotein n=1 Tax=Streptacidiphilus carbonis TaxID=105422 RepID=UPI0006936536|nr:EfeM/EfeO family lipoprotein [Streptacidiphilus carbonis]